MKRLNYYTRRPFIEQACLDLAGNGDALALHGRLMDVAFMDGGSLPLEPDEIRRRAGVSAALWRSWTGRVERKWPVEPDGSRRVNAELLAEMNRARNYTAERSTAGKKGAAGRWPNGSAKGKPKPSHGSALAVDGELNRIELSGLDLNGIETTKSPSSSPTPSDLSSKGNGEEIFPHTSDDGGLCFVPASAVADFDDPEHGFGLAEIEAVMKQLDQDTAADPSKRRPKEAAITTARNWIRTAIKIRARDTEKAPATLVGSHGGGDVLQGAPGSVERATAMAAAAHRTVVHVHRNQRDLDTEAEADQIQKNRNASTRRLEKEAEDDRVLNEIFEAKRKAKEAAR